MSPRYDAGEHATVVVEIHEVLLHSTDSSSDADGVRSLGAKLIPVTVNVDEPEVAPFCPSKFVMTGPSNVTPEARATLKPLARSVYLASCCLPAPDAALAITLVNVTHDVVVAMVGPKNTVGEEYELPREAPLRVT